MRSIIIKMNTFFRVFLLVSSILFVPWGLAGLLLGVRLWKSDPTNARMWSLLFVFSAIILAFYLYYRKKKIIVCGNEIIVKIIFHKKCTYMFSEIDRIERKNNLLRFYKNGHKIFTATWMYDGYDQLLKLVESDEFVGKFHVISDK